MIRKSSMRSFRFLARLAPLLGAILLIAGCGGSSKSHSSKSTTTSATTPTTTTKPVTHPSLPVTVGIITSGSRTPVTSATVAPGAAVSFEARPPGGPRLKSKVTVTLSLGPAKTLTVVASARGHSSTATLTSSNGKRLTLASIHYSCLLPPKSSACPLGKVGGTAKQDTVQVRVPGGTPLIFGASIGPVPGAPAIHPVLTSGPQVPAYKLLERIRATSPPKKGGAPSKPVAASTAVSVKSGDTVSFFVRAVGTAGAPQPLTLKFGDGPAKSITVSANVPNGVSQQVTITSANGQPISVVSPRYLCFLPPSPTFCPATQITAKASGYSASFPITPSTPLVSILATVK